MRSSLANRISTLANNKRSCFTFFRNKLGFGPKKFTKLNKILISTLHHENISFFGYIDYVFIKGRTFTKYAEGIKKTMVFYDKLGFS